MLCVFQMSCNKDAGLKMPFMAECKLAIDDLRSQMQSDSPNLLIDDEELELSELQTGSSPPRCSAHLASKGTNGCPLCKDMLARFPPPSVRMKQPICAKPWDSSSEIAKKFFKVLRFLYAHAMVIDTCPFTLDALAQAFHDKDSMLLGKIHVALLRLLLLDIERELSAEISPRASKDCRFLGFIHAIRQQELDFNFWIQSLNPLTWVEILRQVLISAGFATKKNSMRRTQTKEGNAMAKYGLRPRTLKGELYKILFERASSGSKVAELAKASQIIALDLCTSPTELELLISSALSSDCTLFEKIGPFAYRLRVSSTIMKGINDSLSDTDSGSAEDDSGESNSSSSSDESYSSELDSAASKQSIVRFKRCQKRKSKKLCQSAEIDESFSGEAWLLGLMEGEYSDLSIEEKLDALVALVDLTNSCASLRVEEPVRDMLALIPDKRYCGSGGKLKKALLGQDTSVIPFGLNSSRDCPVDSSSDGSKSSYKGHLSGNRKEYFGPTDVARATNSVAEESGCGMHTLQSIQLGSDRRYNSYWLFLGPCSASDPGHRRVYFESSEDGHWEVIDTEQALSALLSVLDGRGARESHLLSSLKKREPYLCQAMSDFMVNEIGCGQRNMCHLPDTDITSGNSSSPLSDVDNNPVSETIDDSLVSGAVVLEFGKNMEEKKHKWDRLQQFDKWVWASFYCNLNAVKVGNKAYIESLVRCESCHDLYWRDEKHCRICHTTFELDFDLEERYAIHVATCRQMVDAGKFPSHRVLSSQLQALKASIHAVEACMPEDALVDAWTKSAHKLWVKRLRRTSSMPELFQVIGDFVGAIREGWMYECSLSLPCNTALDDIAVLFQTMPQTTSAVALWLVKLDSLIAPHLQRLQSQTTMGATQVKRRRACA
uniref:DDT domain-containing protein DDB_G0282237 n=1 Tax=Anthurium amnicola TaxID=1678845 RepID=A0A1D1XEP5_9ARAE